MATTDTNQQLGRLFHDTALMYRFLGEENPFRAIAYDNAARALHDLPDDITNYLRQGTLDDIPGIGKSIGKEIREFNTTGHIKRFERLKKKVPFELMELMDIRGFGPQSLKKISKRLHLKTRDQVIRALQDGSIAGLKGFGKKKVEGMLRGLKLHKTLEDRMLLWDALQYGEEIIGKLKKLPGVRHVELAGSLRRRKETIGDFDVLIAADQKKRKSIIGFITAPAFSVKVLARGNTRISTVLKGVNRQMDVRIVEEVEWGAALQYFTGSKEHNIHLRSIAGSKGYKISEYGLFNIKTNKRVAGRTEEEIYRALGMQIMPPEMREDRGEIQLAIRHKIPALVELSDIKGDLQMHSTWSDGNLSLEALAKFVRKNFSYEYIAITDHSKASRIAGGMDERGFLKQMKAIKEVNHNFGMDFIKAGAEVDILADGSLDLSDEVLSQLDWVTASIHSGFSHDNTGRLVKACENPNVHCIGHPSGRLIGSRAPYRFDITELINTARQTGTALEINAQPNRMDLTDEQATLAREKGVKLVISTDSHRSTDFYFMRLGVSIARRAWCTPHQILNTRPWKELKKRL